VTDRLTAPRLPEWLETQLPDDRYLVEVEPGLRMHVMEQGHGRPVVLIHGNPTWGYLYRKVVAELSEDPVRLIMPDLVGLGFSDRPGSSSDHTLSNHSRWLSSAMTQLRVAGAVVVVQDWGGAIGIHTAMQTPGLMSGLVALNTILGAPKPGFTPTRFHRVMKSFGGNVLNTFGWPHRHLNFAQGGEEPMPRSVQKAYNYPLSRTRGGNAAVLALARMVPDSLDHASVAPLREVEQTVEAFDGPSAIVWGSRDPVLGRVLRRIARQLPQAGITETDGGHFLQEQRPVEIAAAIRAVVARS